MSASGTLPCVSCHSRCCTDYTVTVTGYDAWLIASRLQLRPEEFLVAYLADEPTHESFRLQPEGPPLVIALAKAGENGESRCAFWLTLPDGHHRCGIYAVRPHVCRTYPAHLRDGIVHIRRNALCPSGAWNLPAMHVPAWRLALLRHQLEQLIYGAVAERWNAHVDACGARFPVGAYYAYVMRVYDVLERRRSEWADETSLLELCRAELEADALPRECAPVVRAALAAALPAASAMRRKPCAAMTAG